MTLDDAEDAMLMAWMRTPTAMPVSGLRPEEFHDPVRREIAAALAVSHANHGVCSMVDAWDLLPIAARDRMLELARESHTHPLASVHSVPALAARMRDEARRVAVRSIGLRLAQAEISPEEAKAEVLAIPAQSDPADRGGSEAVTDALHVLDGPGEPAWDTGYAGLDRVLGGWHAGDLVVLGARPAMGKTALAINLLQRVKTRAGLISGEQSTQQVAMRMIAIDGRVSLHRMRTRTLQESDWSRMSAAVSRARASEYDCRIYDKPAPTLEEIASVAHQWKHRDKVNVLFVDYLQKIRTGSRDDFRLQMGEVASGLKNLARQLGICVVTLAQVKREVDIRPLGDMGYGRIPQPSDLAESSIIEQEADQILTLCRPEVYDPSLMPGRALVSVGKNRHGPVTLVNLTWLGDFLRFEDYAPEMRA